MLSVGACRPSIPLSLCVNSCRIVAGIEPGGGEGERGGGGGVRGGGGGGESARVGGVAMSHTCVGHVSVS